MNWKSPFVWANIVGILLQIVQAIIANNIFPQYATITTIVAVALQAIANALAGATTSGQVVTLKAQLKALKSRRA